MIPAETGERPRGGAVEPWGPAAGARSGRPIGGGENALGSVPETDAGEGRLTPAAEPGFPPAPGPFDLAADVAAL
jgi:hypothetical protein